MKRNRRSLKFCKFIFREIGNVSRPILDNGQLNRLADLRRRYEMVGARFSASLLTADSAFAGSIQWRPFGGRPSPFRRPGN